MIAVFDYKPLYIIQLVIADDIFGSKIAIPIRIATLVTRNLKHAKRNTYTYARAWVYE